MIQIKKDKMFFLARIRVLSFSANITFLYHVGRNESMYETYTNWTQRQQRSHVC